MQSRKIVLSGPLPMTRERAAKLVSAANTYPCGVFLERDNFTVNGKSMLGLLSISRLSCRDLMLVTDGPRKRRRWRRCRSCLRRMRPRARGTPDACPAFCRFPVRRMIDNM